MKNGWHVEYKGTIYEYHRHYVDGKLHREDGPAFIWRDGDVAYYLNGNWLSEAEYWAIQGGELGRILYGRK